MTPVRWRRPEHPPWYAPDKRKEEERPKKDKKKAFQVRAMQLI